MCPPPLYHEILRSATVSGVQIRYGHFENDASLAQLARLRNTLTPTQRSPPFAGLRKAKSPPAVSPPSPAKTGLLFSRISPQRRPTMGCAMKSWRAAVVPDAQNERRPRNRRRVPPEESREVTTFIISERLMINDERRGGVSRAPLPSVLQGAARCRIRRNPRPRSRRQGAVWGGRGVGHTKHRDTRMETGVNLLYSKYNRVILGRQAGKTVLTLFQDGGGTGWKG